MQRFRYRTDVDENDTAATWRLGFVAEDVEAAGVPCAPLQDVGQALAHPQVRARGMVIETAFPDGTPLLAAGNPVKMSGHGDPQVRPGAPALDADRAAILRELGL